MASKALSWQLSSDDPGEARHATVVCNNIDDRECNDDTASSRNIVLVAFSVADGDDELAETTKNEGADKEWTSATVAGHDADADEDSKHSNCVEDTGVFERFPHASHFKEVCAIGCDC